jgi:hypothetical protein
MLPYNHFGVFTFTLHLKILFTKSPQQHAGYHVVSVVVVKKSFQTTALVFLHKTSALLFHAKFLKTIQEKRRLSVYHCAFF